MSYDGNITVEQYGWLADNVSPPWLRRRLPEIVGQTMELPNTNEALMQYLINECSRTQRLQEDEMGNVVAQCRSQQELDFLLNEEVTFLALAAAYGRHSIPVPDKVTKRLAALKREIAEAWRLELEHKIVAHERQVEELRSKEEKKRQAEQELLKALREQAGR